MAFIPGANMAQVNLIMQLDEQEVQNVLYFQHVGSFGLTEAEALGNYLRTWWDVELSANFTNQIQLTSIRITDLSSDSAPVYVYTTGMPVAGAGTGDCPPNNVAFCVSFRTGNRGRSGRGRNYIIGIPEVSYDNSTLNQSAADLIVAAYEEIIIASPGDWTWVVASRYHNNAPRSAILAQPVTTVLWVDLVADSMKRRLPGR